MLPEITKRYSEPHRRYHTIEHPARMLANAARFKIKLTDEQIWAIWLHDLVYEPGAKDNEERSAEEGTRLMLEFGLYLGDETKLDNVERIILDTKDHVARHPQSEVVIDLDLFVFAEDWEYYIESSERVAKEFNTFVGSEEWAEGRTAFLRGMLERKPFFLTKYCNHWDCAARNNIEEEIQQLLGLDRRLR